MINDINNPCHENTLATYLDIKVVGSLNTVRIPSAWASIFTSCILSSSAESEGFSGG